MARTLEVGVNQVAQSWVTEQFSNRRVVAYGRMRDSDRSLQRVSPSDTMRRGVRAQFRRTVKLRLMLQSTLIWWQVTVS